MSADRPSSITCRICGLPQPVGRRGPVPTMCRSCNRRGSERPAEVRCVDCGTRFRPADRGPLPERCWDCSPRHSRASYRQRSGPFPPGSRPGGEVAQFPPRVPGSSTSVPPATGP